MIGQGLNSILGAANLLVKQSKYQHCSSNGLLPGFIANNLCKQEATTQLSCGYRRNNIEEGDEGNEAPVIYLFFISLIAS